MAVRNLQQIASAQGDTDLEAVKKLGLELHKHADGFESALTEREMQLLCIDEGAVMHNGAFTRYMRAYANDNGVKYLELSNDDSRAYDAEQDVLDAEPASLGRVYSRMVNLFGGRVDMDVTKDELGTKEFWVGVILPMSAFADIETTAQFQDVLENCKFKSMDEFKKCVKNAKAHN